MQWKKTLISCLHSPIKFCILDSSNCTIKISYWAPFNYKPRLIVHLSVVCDSRTPVGQGVGRAASRQTRSWANAPPPTTHTPSTPHPFCNIATRSANLHKTLKLVRYFYDVLCMTEEGEKERGEGARMRKEGHKREKSTNTKKQGHLLISPNKDLI